MTRPLVISLCSVGAPRRASRRHRHWGISMRGGPQRVARVRRRLVGIATAVAVTLTIVVAVPDDALAVPVPSAGLIDTLAGGQGSQFQGSATLPFVGPRGLAMDAAGNLYIADVGGHVLRKVTPSGVTSTATAWLIVVTSVSVFTDSPWGLARCHRTRHCRERRVGLLRRRWARAQREFVAAHGRRGG